MNILKCAVLEAAFAVLFSSVSWANTIKLGIAAKYSSFFAMYGNQHLETVQTRVVTHGDRAGEPAIKFLFKGVGLPNRGVAKTLAPKVLILNGVSELAGFTFTPNALAWRHRSTSRNPHLPSSMPPPCLSLRQPRNLPAA